LREKRKQLENHKQLNNVLEKHKKINKKSNTAMCSKNENTTRQNETLKDLKWNWNRIFLKKSIWLSFSISLGTELPV
jgi:hypothetical protein